MGKTEEKRFLTQKR